MSFNLTNEMLLALVGVAVLISVCSLVWLVVLNQKLKNLLGGSSQAKNIESALILIRKELTDIHTFRSELETYLENVEMRLKRSVQGVETMRFNPFKGSGDGGNQSFSSAFIDQSGNGVVISSLYSRERVSMFSKAIKNFESEFELTEEEREVLENARKKVTR